MRSALTVARLRPRIGIDDAIGAALTLVALVMMVFIGIHDSQRPVYGPIDEITHTAYVLAVAKDGIPPALGRDRAFTGPAPMAPRDVRIPPPDKTGSAPVPIGAFNDVAQAEAIQPPFYYYAAAPVTWFVTGRDKVIAVRLFDVLLCLLTVVVIFVAVRDVGGSPLGGGIAALLMASAGGELDVFSYVTNGAMLLVLGATALWLAARGIRAKRVTWPLVAVAAALSITQIIAVPLAGLCVLAPAFLQMRAGGRRAARTVVRHIAVAAVPLALWVLSNIYRYHWITPRAPGSGIGFSAASTTALDLQNFTGTYFGALVASVQEPFHWWQPSPYAYDWRPLTLFFVLTLAGIAGALFSGSERHRKAVGFWLLAFVTAHVTVFCMLYLAVVLTGGGDFVYRYFSAAQVAAVCLAGTCFGGLFRNPALQRGATLAVGLVLVYWTYNASPL